MSFAVFFGMFSLQGSSHFTDSEVTKSNQVKIQNTKEELLHIQIHYMLHVEYIYGWLKCPG